MASACFRSLYPMVPVARHGALLQRPSSTLGHSRGTGAPVPSVQIEWTAL